MPGQHRGAPSGGGWRPAGTTYRIGILLLLALLLLPTAVLAEVEFAAPSFQALWRRTEQPVVEGRTQRPFLWGPAPFASQSERYDDGGNDGQRLVQYFDKGRLELTQPTNPAAELALLQNGTLVRDLTLGLVQVGSNRAQAFDPAFLPVAGDSDLAANPDAARYADFANEVVAGLVRPVVSTPLASAVGKPVTTTVQAGERGVRAADAQPQVLIGAYDPGSGHNIAAPFWEAFGASGLVLDPITGAEQMAPLYDWRLLVGAPITEPAWTTVRLNGQSTLLLVQLFERRVLVYNPNAPAGYQVEMANTGRHYHAWRHGPPPTTPPAKSIAPTNRGRNTRRLTSPPVTPTTPYQVETSLPPSLNGIVTPGVGPGGTRHAMVAHGFRAVELFEDKLSVWVTTPSGRAVPISLADGPIVYADQLAEGIILVADTRQLAEGLWAVTVQSLTQPERTSILYFRVTAEPRELPISTILNPLFWLGLADAWPTVDLERPEESGASSPLTTDH
jgi:hypothetical protein